jgi:hypothetical protein
LAQEKARLANTGCLTVLAQLRIQHRRVDVRSGSWLRENAEVEFANGNFLSTSINLKNRSAGDGRREKAIEKTILHALRARTFSRSQGQSRKSSIRVGKIALQFDVLAIHITKLSKSIPDEYKLVCR